MFDGNFWAVTTVTNAFIPLLIEAHGTVVNNTSIAALIPLPFQAVYCARKAAISNLASNMRLEFKPLGVTVIDVKTGVVNMRFFDNIRKEQTASIPDGSLYLQAKKEVELAMIAKTVDEKEFTDVDVYARKVVYDVLKSSSPAAVWRGEAASIFMVLLDISESGAQRLCWWNVDRVGWCGEDAEDMIESQTEEGYMVIKYQRV